MAGRTGMVVGLYNGEYVHLPLKAVASRRKVNTEGNLWMRVLEATGQPVSMKNLKA
jgi:6-phosphofructokinase 1